MCSGQSVSGQSIDSVLVSYGQTRQAGGVSGQITQIGGVFVVGLQTG